MNMKPGSKKLIEGTIILTLSLLILITIGVAACGSDVLSQGDGESGNETEENGKQSTEREYTETSAQTEDSPTEPEEKLDPAVLTYLEVEAGTPELSTEDYFREYSGQVFTVDTPLTAEQLCAVGSSYEQIVTCDGVEGIVTIKVIDTTAPVIEGAKNRTVYVGASVSYKKNITVTDNSGEEIELKVDADGVDTSKTGSYTVTYTATDSSGNTATVQITLTVTEKLVINEEYVRPMVEKIVNEVTTANMSQWDKAWALYRWCRKNIKYGSAGDRTSIWTGAYEGVHDRVGDCFTYYATYAAMLDIAGIPNMQVSRVGGTSNHWWNLVNVGDGWYHCDTSPRHTGDTYVCFMQTDAQVAAYTESYTERFPGKPNYYTFDPTLYPERGTTIVYGD